MGWRAHAVALAVGIVAVLLGIFVCRPHHLANGPTSQVLVRPGRIVSLAPSITETLFAIGAGDRVVGVTSHCDFPVEVTRCARVGGYDTPNVEVIVDLHPDLVIAPEEGALLAPVKQLRDMDIRVEAVKTTNVLEVIGSVELIGVLTDEVARGSALAQELKLRYSAVRDATRGATRVRTLIVVDRDPTIGAGPGTFLDSLLKDAGGENVLASGPGYPQLSTEAIEGLAPDAILDLCMVKDSSERQTAANARWARHPELHAKIIAIDPDLLVRPGPRLIDGLEQLARALHPEAFPR